MASLPWDQAWRTLREDQESDQEQSDQELLPKKPPEDVFANL